MPETIEGLKQENQLPKEEKGLQKICSDDVGRLCNLN